MGILREYPEALVLALVLHGAIGAVMVLGLDFSSSSPTSPDPGSEPVQAVAVDSSEVEAAVEEMERREKAEEREAIKRQKELRQQLDQLQAQREQQAEQVEDLQQAREQQAQELERLRERKQQQAEEVEQRLAAAAQELPRNVRLVIGSDSTGGDTYQNSAIVADALSEHLGINVKVDAVGASEAFKALGRDSRGTTLMIFHDQSYLANLYGVRGYEDPFESYKIGPTVAINPGNAYLVAKDSPYQSMDDILTAAENGERVRVAIQPGGVSEIGHERWNLKGGTGMWRRWRPTPERL